MGKKNASEVTSAVQDFNTGRVTLLALGHFTNDMYNGFLAPLLPLLMTKIGFGLTLAAMLTSIQAIFNSMAQPFFGYLSDRMHRPYLVAVGPLVTALFLGSIGLVNRYETIVIVLVISGLGTAAFHPQAAKLAGQTSGRRQGLGMSLFVTGGNAGYSLGPVIILSVVSLLGLEYSLVTAVLGVFVSVLLWQKMKKVPQTVFVSSDPVTLLPLRGRFYALLLLWTIVMIRAFVISAFMTFSPIYLHAKNFSYYWAGMSNTIMGFSGSAGSVFGGSLADRIGRKKVIFLSLIMAIPFLYLFLSLDGWLALVFLGFAGVILFASIPVSIVLAQQLFPRQAGTVSSVMMGLAWGIGGILVTPLGALAEKIGIEQGMKILIIFVAAAAIMTLFLKIQWKESPGNE